MNAHARFPTQTGSVAGQAHAQYARGKYARRKKSVVCVNCGRYFASAAPAFYCSIECSIQFRKLLHTLWRGPKADYDSRPLIEGV